MKKFKFFAIAALLLGSTSAFAAITKGEKQTVNGVQYEVLTVFANASSGDNTVKVTSNNYAGTSLVIPATVDLPIEGTDPFGNDVTGTKTFKVVEISKDAFKGRTSITSAQIGANVTTIGNDVFAGCSNMTSIAFDAAAAPQTFGTGLFTGTKLTQLDLSNTKISAIGAWFDVNGTLTTVTLPATLISIAPSAFEDCAALSTVDFSRCALLNSIGNFAFGSTSLTAVDFSACALLTSFTTTPFVPSTGDPNTVLATVTLNTNTTAIGTALAKLEALTTVNIASTKLASVAASAFAGDKKLISLTLPSYTTTIAAGALKDSYVTTLAIKGNATIGATAATKLTEITFSGTSAFTGSILANAFAGNNDLATVTFSKGINLPTGNIIGAGAFSGTTGVKQSLTAVSLGNVTDYDGASIKAGAFVLATGAVSTVTIGNVNSSNTTKADPFAAGAIAGPTLPGISATVTLGNVTAPLANAPVSGNISSFTVGDITGVSVNTAILGAAVTAEFGKISGTGAELVGTATLTTVPTLTSVTFAGNIEVAGGIGALAFAKYNKLATIAITGKMTVGGAVAANSFWDGTNNLYAGQDVTDAFSNPVPVALSYSPLHDDIVVGATREIAQNAFAGALFAGNGVTFTTTRDLGLLYQKSYGSNFWRVTLNFPAEKVTITMAAPEGSTYNYAKFYQNAAYKIAKTQNGETVMVYSAYVDASDAKIYYDQLHIINGYYEIPAKTPVIIKSKAADGIVAEGNATGSSLRYTSGGVTTSEIYYTDAIVGSVLKKATPVIALNPNVPVWTANTAFNLYALGKIAKYGLEWKPFADNAALPDGTFYVRCDKTVDAARLVNVWLDGSEDEATGIQKVQNETEDGAIYNLQGVRVKAAQKGIFIKNGKKYIVK